MYLSLSLSSISFHRSYSVEYKKKRQMTPNHLTSNCDLWYSRNKYYCINEIYVYIHIIINTNIYCNDLRYIDFIIPNDPTTIWNKKLKTTDNIISYNEKKIDDVKTYFGLYLFMVLPVIKSRWNTEFSS